MMKPLDKPYIKGQTIVYLDKTYIVAEVYNSFIAVTNKQAWVRKLIYKCCYENIQVVN